MAGRQCDERVDDLLGQLPEARLELLVAKRVEVTAYVGEGVVSGHLTPF